MPSLNRIVMAQSSRQMVRDLNPPSLEVAEISGQWGKMFNFRSYEQFRYPAYDICEGPFSNEAGKPRKFDLILANQVWEHLDRPYRHVIQTPRNPCDACNLVSTKRLA